MLNETEDYDNGLITKNFIKKNINEALIYLKTFSPLRNAMLVETKFPGLLKNPASYKTLYQKINK